MKKKDIKDMVMLIGIGVIVVGTFFSGNLLFAGPVGYKLFIAGLLSVTFVTLLNDIDVPDTYQLRVKDILHVLLEDDSTSTGGIAHSNETVGEFIAECDSDSLTENSTIPELNKALKKCGIAIIKL